MNFPERDAFQDVFYTHYPSVRRKLMALVRNEAAAEDLAQEVFLRLYRTPPDDPGAVGAWLHRVLTRTAYDYLNKLTRERALLEKQEHEVQTRPEGRSGEEEVLQKLDQEEVRAWLSQLSERDREVLLLRHSGYSYAEIAERLQVRQPLVGMLIQRATARLKRCAGGAAQVKRKAK
ncbi:sigma-70 family RNA polymerase sigma factor [Paenibacillus mucilaginosus]|uniref:ECF subfamily RNA polymerase sigma-24 subunit n=3 Tax=Paenibacillus mucilaginosus TaxID=61624 RepID=H6NDQ4_9BACL|nr:sigma-70 family RNA polymerase sigma factor [Paenibacillus mucilaginosus]AEI42565.1 RNA polymerase, sigma-24 subunit, ECF subfamily [Paenibacillus mucilaginosus KNP414]AFC32103.1 ECF subfamily RNA polymerase sigma-24 subunit [Paenibacillus mucilaginosus 3016]AFH64474.1 RNA polymerase sigma24 factor [Paenibacillus mucilaginosus K02]MCG7213956.1 sigma-70 family RNA polymerase sigma factor [Paenibacillus mucilaginosus]WDM25958.1 sigma-70 family RNA polymerase sigma factor [Paenibacillus mucila